MYPLDEEAMVSTDEVLCTEEAMTSTKEAQYPHGKKKFASPEEGKFCTHTLTESGPPLNPSVLSELYTTLSAGFSVPLPS
jgi:hypothetical protein